MRYAVIFYLLIFLCFALRVNAAEVSINGGLTVNTRFNDNVTLLLNNEIDVVGGNISPQVDLKVIDPDQQFITLIDLNFTRYKENSDLKRDEGKVDLNWAKSTERSKFAIAGGYSRLSSLNQLLDVIGILDDQVYRNILDFNSSWEYQLSEKNELSLTYSFSEVSYDEEGFASGFDELKLANLFDYKQQVLSVTLTQDISEKDKIQLIASLSDYEGGGNGFQYVTVLPFGILGNEEKMEYQSSDFQLTYIHEFSEHEQINMAYGNNNSETSEVTVPYLFDSLTAQNYGPDFTAATYSENKRKSSIYNLSYKYELETNSIFFSARKNITDDASGVLVEQNQFVFNYNNKYSERMSFGISLNAIENSAVVNLVTPSVSDRLTASFSPSLAWRVTKDWYLTARYTYLTQKYKSQNEKVASNAVFVGMSWTWPRLVSTY